MGTEDTPTATPTPQKRSRVKRIVLNSLTGLVLLVGTVFGYIAFGFGLGNIRTHPQITSAPRDHTIYLETNGVHIDFILPNEYLVDDPFLSTLIEPGYNYTAIGWGDKAFYIETPQWEVLTAKNFCRALFWKSDSLMHVSPYFQAQERWVPVHLSDTQVKELGLFISQSFVHTDTIPDVIPDFSYYGDDRFYNALDSYTLFYTCNNWVNEGLSVVGESTSLWSPFDGPILAYARRNAEMFIPHERGHL